MNEMTYGEQCKKIDAAKATNPSAFADAVALEQVAQQSKREFDDLGCLWPTDSAEHVAKYDALEKQAAESRAAADTAWAKLGLA